MKASITFDYKDVIKFKKTCDRLGEKVAIKAANKAAQKGSNIVIKAVRAAAPKDTGALKNGFKKKKEHSRLRGKAVYGYAMDKSKNDIFQKQIKEPGKYGGKKDTAYYPASVEYGFLTSDGSGKLNYSYSAKKKRRSKRQHLSSRKVEGKHFAKNAAKASAAAAQETMKRVLNEELEKAWKRT